MNQYTHYIAQQEGGEDTPTAPWYDRSESSIQTIATMTKGETVFLITGDTARNKVQVMPGGGYSTVRVQVPERWDQLAKEKGYMPLNSFFLNELPEQTPIQIVPESNNNLPVTRQGTQLINQTAGRMEIYDAAGKLVGSAMNAFNLRSLPDGVYMVRVAGYKGAYKITR